VGAIRGVGAIQFTPLDCTDEEMQDGQTAKYAAEQLSRRHDRPFFLCVGFRKPHLPWNVPRRYYDLYPPESIALPPTLARDLDDIPPEGVAMAHQGGDHPKILQAGMWQEAVRGYLASISFVDAMLGRVIDAFDRSAYRNNTIVMLWSDHGWNLGEKEHWRKFALWEETTRAPFLVIVPGLTQPDTRCDRPVDLMSIYPTLTDLCGISTPRHVEGRSLRPLLANPAAGWEQPAVMTWGFNNHAVRAAGWRYIRYARGGEELYDETADPNEWHNLAADPQYAARKAELARWLPRHNAPEVPRRPEPADAEGNARGKSPAEQRRAPGKK
jgi:arylsulfatase A-like enzyme